jgi:hypothetical protein
MEWLEVQCSQLFHECHAGKPQTAIDGEPLWGQCGRPDYVRQAVFLFRHVSGFRIALPIVTAATVPTPAFQNYVLPQLALGGTDSVTGSVYPPFPQSVPFYQKMFSHYGNTNVTSLTVLGCPFDFGGVAPAIANDGNGCAKKSCQLFQSGVFLVWKPVAEASKSSDLSAADAYFGPPYCEAG